MGKRSYVWGSDKRANENGHSDSATHLSETAKKKKKKEKVKLPQITANLIYNCVLATRKALWSILVNTLEFQAILSDD